MATYGPYLCGTADIVSSGEVTSANACGPLVYPSGAGWTSTQANITGAENDVYATCAANSTVTNYIIARNFSALVPVGHNISGVQFTFYDMFRAAGAGTLSIGKVSLWNDGLSDDCTSPLGLKAIGTAKAPGTAIALTTGTNYPVGQDFDTWGLVGAILNPTLVRSANFGVALSVSKSTTATTVSLDAVGLIVYANAGGLRSRARVFGRAR